MIWIDFVFLALLFGAVALMLRSFFFLLRAADEMPFWTFVSLTLSLIGGIGHFLYYHDVAMEAPTRAGLIIFLYGAAYCYYKVSKGYRDKKLDR